VLTPYVPYLIRRWRESGADSVQLWREIRARVYTYSARTTSRVITQLRRAADVGLPPRVAGLTVYPPAGAIRPCGVLCHRLPGCEAVG
jgi:hypothetical protein